MPARRTDAAVSEHMRRAAVRAVDDPAELARAARIVRAALERKALRVQDLDGAIVQPSDLRPRGAVDQAHGQLAIDDAAATQ